jgi:hypothetical protein
MEDYLSRVFDNLDRWRRLPSYQLERRADAFLSAYLPEILEPLVGSRPVALIPEFPVHIPTIYPKVTRNLSFKIDYIAVLRRAGPVVFVELKTDATSRRDKQDWYLAKAREVGLPKLLAGIRSIYAATSAKAKYRWLLGELENAGLVKLAQAAEFEILADETPPRIVYIQPSADIHSDSEIGFVEIADLIAAHPDPLSQRLARSLRDWASPPEDDG